MSQKKLVSSGHLPRNFCLSFALLSMLPLSNAACGSEGSGGGAGGTVGSGSTGGTGGTGGSGGASGTGGSGSCIPCGEGCGGVDCECADSAMVSASACYDVLPQNQCCHYDKTVICPPACATHGGWSGSGSSDSGSSDSGSSDSGSSDSGAPDTGSSSDGGWPATGPCFGVPVIEMGLLPLDGTQQLSSGFANGNMLIAEIISPPSGSSSVTMYEYATPSVWRKAWLSKNRCDTSATSGAGFAQGIGPNFYFTTTPGDAGTSGGPFVMIPGQKYYVMVRNLTLSGQPSCPVNQICDVAVKAYPPS